MLSSLTNQQKLQGRTKNLAAVILYTYMVHKLPLFLLFFYISRKRLEHQITEPTRNYMNSEGYEVPSNRILLVPHSPALEVATPPVLTPLHKDIVRPLKGQIKRDWFDSHFYYCLPLNIGNQCGFTIHSQYDFEVTWNGTNDTDGLKISMISSNEHEAQFVESRFGRGILTISHPFYFKTPKGVNLMTIQPPNLFTPGVVSMTGVVETDQLRRDFSFNLKFTDPGKKVTFKKGDVLSAFIPIPRYFVDSFELAPASDFFSAEVLANEYVDQEELNRQRNEEDLDKHNSAGRKYFNGEHAFGEPFEDHQKNLN